MEKEKLNKVAYILLNMEDWHKEPSIIMPSYYGFESSNGRYLAYEVVRTLFGMKVTIRDVSSKVSCFLPLKDYYGVYNYIKNTSKKRALEEKEEQEKNARIRLENDRQRELNFWKEILK